MKLKLVPSSPFWLVIPLVAGLIAFFWLGRDSALNFSRPGLQHASDAGRQPDANDIFRYTPPVKIDRLINEWETQEALIITLSFPEARGNSEIVVSTIDVLEAAHEYLNIYVFCEYEHSREFAYFLSKLREHPKGEAILEKTHFVDSRNLMRWVRDFGPVFGVGRKQELVAIDFVFRNMLKDLESLARQTNDAFRDFMALQGDAMPADVVAMIEREFETEVQLIRPPVSMDGGDLISDGRGNVFISTQTLARNGTNRQELEKVFQEYFGAKKLHVLEALPGASVRHLDMIFKFIDHDTVVLPDYKVDETATLNSYRKELTRKVLSVLEKNEAYLRKNFPKHTFIKVPMPPILFLSKEEIFHLTRQEFYRTFVKDRDLLTPEELEKLTPVQRQRMEAQILEMVKKETGLADVGTTDGFNAILAVYDQPPLDSFLDLDAEAVTRYRSYINSVFLNPKSGKQAFLVPRFSGQNARESALIDSWEKMVESAYRSAYPKADIRWINSDSMVEDMGFLHCITITVPALPLNSRQSSAL
ncbi:MAG: agmatine deiminase family protein [Verrucomicrobia bacterium]|nr:agmatine deiminase family protein [Verrucomicrobiota bacterium]MDA1068098.1 agmatine deiminase family protein [Verrucomicrobiota bacterium]